ncbi:MAG TPA: glycosyltransferase family 25 protein [Chlamydiales bacterium]|nr:glycosyltransferase family 25 protein [Chlamydiales bacterium]
MLIFCRLFFLIIGCSLFADLEDHLKKALNKSDEHKIDNVDFIYIINLDQRPEKLKQSLDQLSCYDIHPYRFSAVNGWELSIEAINDVGLKYSPEMASGIMGTSYHTFEPSHEMIEKIGQTYFCHCLARGTVGIALSHISVLQDAENSGYETIWVMEDDIEVRQDPRVISLLIEQLDQAVGRDNWDILFTDRDMKNANGQYIPCTVAGNRPDFMRQKMYNNYAIRRAVPPHFEQIGARNGAHSMIIRKSGIKKLLNFFYAHQIFLPYDMDFILPTGIQLFAVTEDVVSNLPRALSDNGGANYLKKE